MNYSSRVFYRIVLAALVLFFAGSYQSKLFSQEKLTVEKIYKSHDFSEKSISQIRWTPEKKAFTYLTTNAKTRDLEIWRYTLKSGKQKLLLSSKDVPQLHAPVRAKRFLLPSYYLSPNGKEILLPSHNDLFVYNLKNKHISQLTNDAENERDPRFSPDGKMIAFLKHHNLWVLNLADGSSKQLTVSGQEHVYIGRFDWVYEEEFGIRTGFFWSPDSKKLAFFKVDERPEPKFPIVNFIRLHNTVEWERYPNPGDENAIVNIGVVNVASKRIVWMDTGKDSDHYIPRIKWLPNSQQVAIQRLNRLQNRLEVLLADVKDGHSLVILTETRSNGWINVNHNWTFLEHGHYMLWSSNRSGYTHLYLYNWKGKEIRQITRGNWDVTGLVGINQKKKWIYFMADKESPLGRQFYRIKWDGSDLLSLSRRAGMHSVTASPNAKYFLDSFSNVTTPPQLILRNASGKRIRMIKSGKIPALRKYIFATPKFFQITLYDTLKLNAYMMKPIHFDSTKKYPVLIYTYGGPGSQTVTNSWRNGWGNLWHQLMVQKGYIVFSVDNRGTGARGAVFQFLVYKNIGGYSVNDQIAAAKYLSKLPYVDPKRIGIWGWSGGGYMTIMCMLKGADVFHTGVAVAPVTDFRNYDSIWTERYMQTPQLNPEGYEKSSALKYAGNLEGKLLILHGLSDDNVHFANTVQLIKKFQELQKPFDLMVFPRKQHSIRGAKARIFLFRKMTDYFLKNL